MSGHSVSHRTQRPVSISCPSPLPIPLLAQSPVLQKPFILPRQLIPKSTQPLWARADYREGTSFFSSAVVHCILVLVMALFASSPPQTRELLLVVSPTESIEEMLSQVEFAQEELELPELEEQPLTPTLVTSSAIESTPLEVDPNLDPTSDVLLDGSAGLEEMLPVGGVLSQIGRGGGRIGAGGGGPAAGDLNLPAGCLVKEPRPGTCRFHLPGPM